MPTCPKCNSELRDVDLPSGTCPVCHAVVVRAGGETLDIPLDPSLPAEPIDTAAETPGEDGDTVEGNAIDMTIEGVSPPAEPPPPIPNGIDQTLDSDSDGTVGLEATSFEARDKTQMPDPTAADIAPPKISGTLDLDSAATGGAPPNGIDQTLDSDSDGTVGPEKMQTLDTMPADSPPPKINGTLDLDPPSTGGAPQTNNRDCGETFVSDFAAKGTAGGTLDLSDGTLAEPFSSGNTVDAANTPETGVQGYDQTLAAAARQAGPSIHATFKSDGSDQSSSTSTLVIQQRQVHDSPDRSHTGADYDLLDLLGQGGMGMVYAARQASIDRTVAFKMIKPENSAKQDVRNKFLSEACVTGDLEHPNIVPIYDVGRNSEGAFFYAMKRVQGTPWDDVVGEKSQHENVEILMKVCDAVAFAHFKGIVHRDLKPENVMLGGFGEVLVMDWGLAIPTDSDRRIGGVKLTPGIGGTPAYMAPEMATGPFDRISPASDIYLLGAILYEITTGLCPHTGKTIQECLVSVSRNTIQPTDKKSELIDIALHAMETKTDERYASVTDFQDAIRQYQSHSESIALAARATEHLSRAEESGSYEQYSQALFGFQQALELWAQNEKAAVGLAEAKLKYATAAKAKGDYDLAAGLLDITIEEHAALHRQITAAQLERDARQQRLRSYKRIGAALAALLFVVITAAAVVVERARREEAQQRELAVAAQEEEKQQRLLAENATALAVQREKEADAAREEEKQQRLLADKRRQEAEDARKSEQLAREAEAYEAYVARIGAAVSRIEDNAYDSARALLEQCIPDSPEEKDHRNWEWGRLWYLCQQASRTFRCNVPLETIAYAVGENGTIERFAVAGLHGKGAIWNADGRKLADIDAGNEHIHSLAFTPDGQQLAAGTADESGFIKVFDGHTGSLESVITGPDGRGHTQAVLSVEYSADGRRLLTGSRDGFAKVWDTETGEILATLHGHRWWVWQATFCPPDGNTKRETKILTVSQDGAAIVWSDDSGNWNDPENIQPAPRFDGHDGPVYAAACSPDGRTIATAGHDQRVLLWNIADLQEFNFEQALASDTPVVSKMSFRALVGHTAAVRSLAFSQDGRRLISGGHDNTVRIWSVESGQTLKTLRGHGEWVRSCILTPDDKTVLSAGFDQVAYLWDVEGYEETRVLRGKVLEGHEDSILAASFTKAADRVVSASRDRTIKTWDSITGDELLNFREGHTFLASNAVFFDNGKKLATAAVDNTVRIWDAETGSQIQLLKNTGRGAVLAVSPDGERMLTGGPKEETTENERPRFIAQIWDIRSGKRVASLTSHTGQVSAVAYSPDGQRVFTGDATGMGILWNAKTGHLVRRMRWHQAKVIAAHFLADNRTLVTASAERAVAKWDFHTGEVDESSLLLHPTALVAADVDPGQRLVATVCEDNQLRLWSLDTAELLQTLAAPSGTETISNVSISPGRPFVLVSDSATRRVHIFNIETGEEVLYRQTVAENGPFLSLSERSQLWGTRFSPDGQHVLTVGGDQIRLWELNRDQLPFRRLRMNFSPHGVVASAQFSTDGSRIVSGSWDGTTNIWDAATGTTVMKLVGKHSGPVNCSVFSPDDQSRYIVTASADSTAVLWDAKRGEFLKRFVGHTGGIRCVSFSPDLTRVVTAAEDGMVGVWDIDNGQEPTLMIQAHAGPVMQAAFSADGSKIVSGGSDNTAKTWNAVTGEPELTLIGHTASVTSVAFTPDGKRVLTGSEDFRAKLWDAGTGKELLTLSGHEREVTSVSFSTDRLNVLTSSHDGTAIMWMASPWDAS